MHSHGFKRALRSYVNICLTQGDVSVESYTAEPHRFKFIHLISRTGLHHLFINPLPGLCVKFLRALQLLASYKQVIY